MQHNIHFRLRFVRKDEGIRTLVSVDELKLGDELHMVCRYGKIVLIREDRGEYSVLRCHGLGLNPAVPKGKGIGTALHRAAEDKVRELGLLFCTADAETIGDNRITGAMRHRLLALYPDHVPVGDAYVLLGERLEPVDEEVDEDITQRVSLQSVIPPENIPENIPG